MKDHAWIYGSEAVVYPSNSDAVVIGGQPDTAPLNVWEFLLCCKAHNQYWWDNWYGHIGQDISYDAIKDLYERAGGVR